MLQCRIVALQFEDRQSPVSVVIEAGESGYGNGQRTEGRMIAHNERTRLRGREVCAQRSGPDGERDADGDERSADKHDYTVPFTHRCTYG